MSMIVPYQQNVQSRVPTAVSYEYDRPLSAECPIKGTYSSVITASRCARLHSGYRYFSVFVSLCVQRSLAMGRSPSHWSCTERLEYSEFHNLNPNWNRPRGLNRKSRGRLSIRKLIHTQDRPCGLAVRVPSCRSRGSGFDSWRYKIFWESSGCGTRSTQPRECNWRATTKKKYRIRYRKPR
jgi:hypothetical protein